MSTDLMKFTNSIHVQGNAPHLVCVITGKGKVWGYCKLNILDFSSFKTPLQALVACD